MSCKYKECGRYQHALRDDIKAMSARLSPQPHRTTKITDKDARKELSHTHVTGDSKRTAVSAESPDKLENWSTIVVRALSSILNAYSAWVMTPKSTSPAKYFCASTAERNQ